MGLRPAAACWFEILTPRDQLTRALRCLARTGAVELQAHSQTSATQQLPDLRQGLEEFDELQRRYGEWWPTPAPQCVETAAEPAAQLTAAIQALRDWADDAAPLIVELQGIGQMIHDLETLRDVLSASQDQLPNLHRLAAAGPYLEGRLFALPAGAQLTQVPPAVLLKSIETESQRYLIALGERREIEALDRQLAALRARPLTLPRWLPEAGDALAAVDERLAAASHRQDEKRGELETVHDRHQLADALGRLYLLDWYVTHIPELPVTEHFAWITGWTSDPKAELLSKALEAERVRHLLRLTEPPPGVECPMVLRNPLWARPFELFGALLGTPGAQDVDPSRLLALIAPLMFGYMFGDVGQGAVLLIAGLLLHRRIPALGLLIPGGIAAIAFGFVFGSVFASEDLLRPLWLHPIADPVPVLAASLIFGVVVVTVGLALDAIQYHWRGEATAFWGARVGLAVTYAGLLAAFREPLAAWLIPVGAAWFIAGAALTAPGRGLGSLGTAIQEYVEVVLQLFVNTISFVRVGAFALAHAGLSAAVMGMADATGSVSARLVVLVLGNALIIGLEGLVVSIQTTRLVLFEFFIRFLRASGRRFRPLPGPDETDHGPERRAS
jgi:V/A-type H+-transporting ATPase subunit I